jgi:O-methyltransferase
VRKFTQQLKFVVKKILPKPLLKPLGFIYSTFCRTLFWISFIFDSSMAKMSFSQRLSFAIRSSIISLNVACPHSEDQIVSFVQAFLSIPPDKEGCIVEAGSYKGGSTAKFSIGAKIANRQLVVFDSFEGLPENEEPHERSILGHSIKAWFTGGSYCGSLDEVKSNIGKYGQLESCTFVKGWFEDTMPPFSNKICAAYLDVDLASSTRTCLKYLYPLIIRGVFSIPKMVIFPL